MSGVRGQWSRKRRNRSSRRAKFRNLKGHAHPGHTQTGHAHAGHTSYAHAGNSLTGLAYPGQAHEGHAHTDPAHQGQYHTGLANLGHTQLGQAHGDHKEENSISKDKIDFNRARNHVWGNRSSATPLAPLMAPLPPLMAPLASSVTPLAYTVTPLPYFKQCERPSLVPKSSDDFKKTPKDFCYKLKYQKGYCTRAYQEELDQQEFNLRAYDEEQAKIKKDAEEKLKELADQKLKELADQKNNIWKAVPDNTENIVAKTNIAINSAPEVQEPPKLAILAKEKLLTTDEEISCRFKCGENFKTNEELNKHEVQHMQLGIDLKKEHDLIREMELKKTQEFRKKFNFKVPRRRTPGKAYRGKRYHGCL